LDKSPSKFYAARLAGLILEEYTRFLREADMYQRIYHSVDQEKDYVIEVLRKMALKL
jgi:hypothetical protein